MHYHKAENRAENEAFWRLVVLIGYHHYNCMMTL